MFGAPLFFHSQTCNNRLNTLICFTFGPRANRLFMAQKRGTQDERQSNLVGRPSDHPTRWFLEINFNLIHPRYTHITVMSTFIFMLVSHLPHILLSVLCCVFFLFGSLWTQFSIFWMFELASPFLKLSSFDNFTLFLFDWQKEWNIRKHQPHANLKLIQPK